MGADKTYISPDVIRSLLSYEQETGKLFWKPRDRSLFKTQRGYAAWHANFSGKEAFIYVDSTTGYRKGAIFGRTMYSHRVIWAIVHGDNPKGQIDHINGVRTDNRIVNLRDVSRSENNKNIRLKNCNTSGFNGVSWSKGAKKWVAYIQDNGKRKVIGYFHDLESAANARAKRDRELNYHENHGKAA